MGEIAIKVSLGKLTLNSTVEVFINKHVRGNNIKILNIELHHIFAVATLPFYHRDPFDRPTLLPKQFRSNPILSADKKLDSYPITEFGTTEKFSAISVSSFSATQTPANPIPIP
ncbi:MAG: type II toxin-antitoxin system VapC family toxin [Calditrichia bacterium]